MGRIKLKHLAIPLLFAFIVLYSVHRDGQYGSIFKRPHFTVALNQAYIHCNHTEQDIKITLTMDGNSETPILVKRIYVSFDNGWKRRLPIPQIEFTVNSGDIVKEFPITLTGRLLDEAQHHQVPHIAIVFEHEGYQFTLKDSCPVW